MSRRRWIVTVCLAGLPCLPPSGSAAAADAGAASCVMHLLAPYPEQEVSAGVAVEGIALLPPGHHLWVFARRADFAPLWWPQGEGVPDPASGRWKVLATIGEPQDVGRSFDLAVAVFAGEEHARLRDWLAQSTASGAFRPLAMPAAVCPPELRTLRKTRAEPPLHGARDPASLLPRRVLRMDRLDCGYHLEKGRGSFRTADDEWIGAVDLGPAALARLKALELVPNAYGELLFDILFPPGSKLLEGYRTTEVLARDHQQVLRVRLHLTPEVEEEALTLSWELICDHVQKTALARSQWITFAMSLRGPRRPPDPVPTVLRPRVLIAVADASDLGAYQLSSLAEIRSALAGKFRRLWWWISSRFLRGPVTLTALQQELQKGRFHALHLVAHGLPPAWTDQGVMLQGEDGLAQAVHKESLAEALSDCPDLRLVVLEVCHGGTSLAPPLLRRGIPVVVALRREVSIPAAELFTGNFYSVLARSGEVDHAVNEARRLLALPEGVRRHWSDPVLYWGRAPWRKGWRGVSSRLVMAGVCTLGIACGWVAHPEPDLVPPCPPSRLCPEPPVCPSCPPRPRPVLQVTRVAGQEVTEDQEVTVPPAGDIEGTFLIPPEPYVVRAESLADGTSVSQNARSAAAAWALQQVRFRRLENAGETHATVTIEAGAPPDVASRVVRVRVAAPEVTIQTVCGRPLKSAAARCKPLTVEGTAHNVLAQDEQIWVEIQRPGAGTDAKCLYASVVGDRWRVEDSWSGGDATGPYRIRAGLVAQPPEGRACPEGREPLLSQIVP